MTGGESGEACLPLLCNHIPPTAAAQAVRDSLLHLLTNSSGERGEEKMTGIITRHGKKSGEGNYDSDLQIWII